MPRAPRLTVERIAVDRQGYDHSGAYWGAGPPVFIVSKAAIDVGSDEETTLTVTLRARNAAEARRSAAPEIARQEMRMRASAAQPQLPVRQPRRRAAKMPAPR